MLMQNCAEPCVSNRVGPVNSKPVCAPHQTTCPDQTVYQNADPCRKMSCAPPLSLASSAVGVSHTVTVLRPDISCLYPCNFAVRASDLVCGAYTWYSLLS